MIPSLWTAIIMEGTLSDVLRFLHGCGWRCFELSTEHLEAIANDPAPQARIEEITGVLAELGATMPQAHAYIHADIAHPDPARRETDIRLLERHLDCCAQLGIAQVVIHPGGRELKTPDDFRRALEHNIQGFTRLADRAGALGLRIGLENTLGGGSAAATVKRSGEPFRRRSRRRSRDAHCAFGSVPDELLDLIASVGSPVLGVTFDTSHAHVRGLDLPAAIRQLGPLICATHISDNDGSSDQHRTPGGGTIDWPGVMSALREIGYHGRLNFEIPGEEHPQRELLALKMRHALAVADWLIGRTA